MQSLRLKHLPLLARVGVSCAIFTLLLGFWASREHLTNYHANRDGKPEDLSMQDLTGAYHGVSVPAPMVSALERGHPEELPAEESQALLDWLRSDNIGESFDDPDLGYLAPAEILDARCLDCHSKDAEDPIGEDYPLDYYDDVVALAYPLEINPPPREILAMSTHTHALAMGVLALVVGLLCLGTRFHSTLKTLPMFLGGVGLFADLAGWWLARESVVFVYVLLGGGAAFGGAMVLGCVLILLELWLPGGGPQGEAA